MTGNSQFEQPIIYINHPTQTLKIESITLIQKFSKMIEQNTTFNLVKLRYFFIGSVHIQPRGINQRIFNHNQLCQFALCFSWFLTFQNEDGINIFKLRHYRVKVQIAYKTPMNVLTPKYKITNTSLYTNNICAKR